MAYFLYFFNYFLDSIYPDKEKGRAFLFDLKQNTRYENDAEYRVTVDTMDFILEENGAKNENHILCLCVIKRT